MKAEIGEVETNWNFHDQLDPAECSNEYVTAGYACVSLNRALDSSGTVDFDQIFFEGQTGYDDKGVRRLMIPKNFLSDLAHGRQVIPIRYICRHLYNICQVHAGIV